ncbi:MAG TPA: AAA family ATPase, partial [Ktedonobacteraceae bacterium]|nr:AAA family ATPase [Ktedonobacteraceae bacterium]
EEHVTRIDQLNNLFSTLQRAQEARRADLQKLERELQTLVGRINELNKTISTAQRDLERLQTELKMAASLEQQLAAEVTGLEQEIQAAQERVQAHEKAQRELAGLVETLQQAVEDQAATYRREQDELGKLRTSVAVKRQEARALHQQLLNAQAQIKDLKQQVEQQVAILKEAEQQQQALRLVIVQRRTELGEAQVQAKSLADSVSRAETQVQAVEQQISTLDQQMRQMHKQTAELEVSYRKCLLDKQKAQDALDALAGQLQEEMGISDPQELLRQAQQEDEASSSASHESVDLGFLTPDSSLSEAEEAELRKLRRRVDSLRSRLKSLGGCDPNAPQQYEEEKTRFEFLSSQVSDMDQAALQLRTIIGQLDATMAKQFEITFEAVNSRFREHFTTLFNGGSARLELLAPKETETEGEDKKGFVPGSMPSGVEVIVQPPGKKVQDLSLLSGGERALISAALLFALLEINPPPFCLLDEVDAALDESNVTRFCDILKRLAENTQFIVITHNRVTMTAAQAIYGVSMGGDSASRLLSLKLEEPASPGRSKQPLPVSR